MSIKLLYALPIRSPDRAPGSKELYYTIVVAGV